MKVKYFSTPKQRIIVAIEILVSVIPNLKRLSEKKKGDFGLALIALAKIADDLK